MSKSDSSPLQHHFEDLRQQYSAAHMGTWLFLLTEIMFFGGFFLAYMLYHYWYPEAFAAASSHLSVFWGTFNTAVLIASSFTMVLAVHAAKEGKSSATVRNLLLTAGLGLIFMVVKAFEYYGKFQHHLVPNSHFEFHGVAGPGAKIFYSLYFGMTGLHALHMIVGLVFVILFAVRAHNGQYTKEYNTPVDMLGLYWHFVDLVWIFLFPLLYLIER